MCNASGAAKSRQAEQIHAAGSKVSFGHRVRVDAARGAAPIYEFRRPLAGNLPLLLADLRNHSSRYYADTHEMPILALTDAEKPLEMGFGARHTRRNLVK